MDSVKLTVPLEEVRYDTATGLVPVVVQDHATGDVLMVAYANREALKRTLGTGDAWFWSRSRQEYWHKGATSGNVQHVHEVRVDCDGDTVLYLVEPAGPACHTGENSCFFRRVKHGGETMPAKPDVHTDGDPATVIQAASADVSVLDQLWNVISQRFRERPQGSYTTYLFEHGVDKVAKKVGEEAVEVAIAAKNAVAGETGQAELVSESADLLYHLLALWKTAGITPEHVYSVLQQRSH